MVKFKKNDDCEAREKWNIFAQTLHNNLLISDIYINLDANIMVSSSEDIGDVVYTIFTHNPYEVFDMITHSRYFKLVNSK